MTQGDVRRRRIAPMRGNMARCDGKGGEARFPSFLGAAGVPWYRRFAGLAGRLLYPRVRALCEWPIGDGGRDPVLPRRFGALGRERWEVAERRVREMAAGAGD